jgi:hypothetical protein
LEYVSSPSAPVDSISFSICRMASDHAQQAGRDLRIQNELAVAKTREEVFTRVRHSFELVEVEEAAGPFDRVDGAKDAG